MSKLNRYFLLLNDTVQHLTILFLGLAGLCYNNHGTRPQAVECIIIYVKIKIGVLSLGKPGFVTHFAAN